MMFVSNLLSMNIHDSLTFDGTELCLHPDLFIISDGKIIGSTTTTTSTTAAASTSSSTTAVPVAATGGGGTGSSSQHPLYKVSSNEEISSNINNSNNHSFAGGGGASTTTTNSTFSTAPTVSVGDMIEIRVWDPLPKDSAVLKNPHPPPTTTSTYRKNIPRQTPPTLCHPPSSSQSTVGTIHTTGTGNSTSSTVQVDLPSSSISPQQQPPLATTGTTTTTTTTATTSASSSTSTTTTTNLRPRTMLLSNSLQYADEVTAGTTMNPSTTATSAAHNAAPTSKNSTAAVVGGTTTTTITSSSAISIAGEITNDNSTVGSSSRERSTDRDDTVSGEGGGVRGTTPIPPTKTVVTTTTATTSTSIFHQHSATSLTGPSSLSNIGVGGGATTAPGSGSLFHHQASHQLPPVFPRPRPTVGVFGSAGGGGGNGTGMQPDTTNKSPFLSKPPHIHRRIPSAPPSTPTQQKSPKFTRHSREISDMTAETQNLDMVTMMGDMQTMGSHDADDTTAGGGGATAAAGAAPATSAAEAAAAADMFWSKLRTTHKLRLSFVFLVTEKTFTMIKPSARTQISMLRQVADLYSLSSYDTVTVHKIEKQDEEEVLQAVSADFVVLTIKDQFISRGDLHLFQLSMIGSWIYEGQRLNENARMMKAHAKEIRHGNFAAKSGIITQKTMITFRSRSARIIWLVQLSSEMWDYASPYGNSYGSTNNHNETVDSSSICEIYFDKWIRFVYKIFNKWKELEVTHSLTVVFFSRTFLSNGQKSSLNCRDVYGRHYEDHYKPVIENETCADWESLIVRIKEAFIKYPLEVGWNLSDRRPSSASQGNFLEAINVTLNIMQFHFMDRDFHRTGNSIVVISPGCGVFEVDKGLAGITYQRMMDNGIGSDMLSLGLPPLHIVPFFLYNNEYRAVETRGVNTSETYYEVPHWMHLSFISYDTEGNVTGEVHKKQDTSMAGAKTASWLSNYEVTTNGFLRPTGVNRHQQPGGGRTAAAAKSSQEPGSPLHRFSTNTSAASKTAKSPTSSFSAMGNAAATPRKTKKIQERQLISGRDFRDILEACRPRMAGVKLPSALVSLLKLQQLGMETEKVRLAGSMMKCPVRSDKYVPLREWGAVDFTEYTLQPKSRRGRSESPNLLRMIGESISGDRSDESDSGSNNSSSFASQVSSLFGLSYDRVFWDYHDSPGAARETFQIQRSPSVEFEKLDGSIPVDSDTALSDDSMSVETGASRSSTGKTPSGIVDVDSWVVEMQNTPRAVKQDKNSESLRRMMQAHDASVCAPLSPSAVGVREIKIMRLESSLPAANESELANSSSRPASGLSPSGKRVGGKETKGQVGYLGDALSQYSNMVNGKMSQPDTPMGSRPTRRSSNSNVIGTMSNHSKSGQGPTFQNERARASSPLFPSIPQFHDRAMWSMSPKLMPPINSLQQSDPPDNLMRPPDDGTSGTNPVQRSMLSSSAATAPTTGAAAIAAGPTATHDFRASSSSLYYGSPTPGLVIPAGGGVNYDGVGSRQSLTQGSSNNESARQRIRQLSRSPPSSNNRLLMRQGNSPPLFTGMLRDRPLQRSNTRDASISSQRQSMRRRKPFNPFRQSDEDEVLAKRSHNRRRWSHVFPVGEVEFKRHSGPIWNSLTTPAILPISVDYFPSPQELRDEGTFQFSPYTVTLSGMDRLYYSTHAELLMELVRQRVTQDFQIVTAAAVEESQTRAEAQRQGRAMNKAYNNRGGPSRGPRDAFVPSLPTIQHDTTGTTGTIKHYLSMGHRIQVLNYDPSSDTIEIVHYNKKSAQNDATNVYKYRFLLFSNSTEKFSQSIQIFKKYGDPYKWNKVDNLICGEEDRTMEEGMRFRRVMFELIPEKFKDVAAEKEYISKFSRLVEYLGKLREKEDRQSSLDIKIISRSDQKDPTPEDDVLNTRKVDIGSRIRFTVRLRKGKRDPFEWIEIVVDPTFDTSRSYRIMINWLVASSAKVETQVNLLLRRCSQFGLNLVACPQTTISTNLFLHAFAVPTLIGVKDQERGFLIESELKRRDFIDDGIHFTDPQVLECIESGKEYDFPKYRRGRIKDIPARQYVHRSGALYIRFIRDRQGWVILAGIENYRHANKENGFRERAKILLGEITQLVDFNNLT